MSVSINEITKLQAVGTDWKVEIEDGYVTLLHDGDQLLESYALADVDAVIALLTAARERIAGHIRYVKKVAA